MTNADRDPLFDLLARLPQSAPSLAATARVQERSRALLASRLQPPVIAPRTRPRARLFQAAVFLVCALYLTGAFGEAVRLTRVIW